MVMFRKKSDTDDTTLQEIMARLEGLHGQIPGLLDIRCHRSLLSDRPVVWALLLDSSVVDAEALALRPTSKAPRRSSSPRWTR
jgi:hypothetical protein